MSQVFSKTFGKVRLFGIRMCQTRPNQEFGFELSRFLGCPNRVRVELFSRRDMRTRGCRRVGSRSSILFELGVTRWLEKHPVPLAVQAQEPKTKVVPSGTLLALLDPAIKFVGELAESPTWRASCRCSAGKPAQGYPYQ